MTPIDDWTRDFKIHSETLESFSRLAGRALRGHRQRQEDHNRREAVRRQLQQRLKRARQTLTLYQPLPKVREFHESRAKWRILDGSNQASKTTGAVVEMLRACLNRDPGGKYPKRDGIAVAVGLNLDHVADPMFRKMWEPGAIKLIPDEKTGRWRAVRLDPENPMRLDPYDEAYREKWRDAPPLLPRNEVKIAWENRAKGIPDLITFTRTGWKLKFYSSMGDSPQGFFCNVAWIDEQIENEQFYVELNRGLMREDENARAFWSATPQTDNEQLLDLREKADAGAKHIFAVKLLLEENPHISKDAREAFFESLTAEEREVRYYGNYAMRGRYIYRDFDPMGPHGCEPFEIPNWYCRYLVLDPGRQYCGTLFGAIDPDEKHGYIYDGFLQLRSDANLWADEVQRRIGPVRFETFLIDRKAGETKTMGQSETVAWHYWEALKARGIRPRVLGDLCGFYTSTTNVSAREEALLGWMRVRTDLAVAGTARLQVFRGTLPELERQVSRARYKPDDPNKRLDLQEDLLDCLEYFAAYNPYYYPPDLREEEPDNPVVLALEAKNRKKHRTGCILMR